MAQKAMGTKIKCLHQGEETLIGRLRSIGEIRASSENVDVTTLDAPGGYRMYEQGVKDMGEVALEGFFEAGEVGQAKLRALYESGESVPFTVIFPDETAVAFSAFVKSHALGAAEVNGAVSFSALLRLTGGVEIL